MLLVALLASCHERQTPSVQPMPSAQPAPSVQATPSAEPTPSAPPAPSAPYERDRVPAETMSYLGADWLTRPERIEQEQPERMLDVLGIKEGMTVADIGAGVGYHAIRLSARVGNTGHVLATDIQPQMLKMLKAEVKKRRLSNVEAVLSSDASTGLPAGSVDLALMVDVYHELSEPERFLAELAKALKPTGRLVLVEFRAEDPKVPIKAAHKMTAAQAVKELGAAGFGLVERSEVLPWQHILIFARPTVASAPSASPGKAAPPH